MLEHDDASRWPPPCANEKQVLRLLDVHGTQLLDVRDAWAEQNQSRQQATYIIYHKYYIINNNKQINYASCLHGGGSAFSAGQI